MEMIQKDKKALSMWISWILLTGLVIIIAASVMIWSKNFASDNAASTERQFYNTDLCSSISIKIDEIYYKNPQTLYITTTNSYNLRIEKIIFEYYRETDRLGVSYTKDIVIKPGMSKSFEIPADSRVGIEDVKPTHVEAVPVAVKEDNDIICQDKRIRVEIS